MAISVKSKQMKLCPLANSGTFTVIFINVWGWVKVMPLAEVISAHIQIIVQNTDLAELWKAKVVLNEEPFGMGKNWLFLSLAKWSSSLKRDEIPSVAFLVIRHVFCKNDYASLLTVFLCLAGLGLSWRTFHVVYVPYSVFLHLLSSLKQYLCFQPNHLDVCN